MSTTHTASTTDAAEPYHEQIPFLWDEHRYYGFISGVGAGKTATGVFRTVINAEVWNPGEMGAIVAPSSRMIKNAIFPVMEQFGVRDRWEFTGFQAEEPGFHTPQGGRIVILSADNERTVRRLANLNLAYWWLDEARETPKEARDILRERLRVGNYRNGYITTTPNGHDHNYNFFVGNPEADGELRTRDWGEATIYEAYGDRLCVAHVPSWANPHNPEDFNEEMRGLPEKLRQQQAEGRFVTFEGRIYPWFEQAEHVVADIPTNYNDIIYGVDFGFSESPDAIVALAFGHDGHVYVIGEHYQRGQTAREHAEAAVRLQEDLGKGRFYCDPSEPASIEELKHHGLGATKAENSVEYGIRVVDSYADRLRVLDRCTHTIEEFEKYHYDDDKEQPVDAFDHTMDCIRYALATHRGGRSTGVYELDWSL